MYTSRSLPRGRSSRTRTLQGAPMTTILTTRRKLLLSAAGLAVTPALFAAPAFAEDSLDRVKKQGFIRIGFANEAPYGYATPDGKLTGEAPEVAKAVLAKMGINEVDGVLTEFGSLIPGL